MARLNSELLKELGNVLQITLNDYPNFRAFVQQYVQGVPKGIDDILSVGAAFDVNRWQYITYLNDNDFIHNYLAPFFAQYTNVPEVQALKAKVELIIDSKDPSKYNESIFNCYFLAKKKLTFIGRSNLKKFMYKLVHNEENKHVFLNGESGSGLSYIYYYLNDISVATNSFKLVKIDLDTIFKRVKGQIQMAHIAREFITNMPEIELDFTLTEDERFKYEEFIIYFWRCLNKTTTNYLFFFDQFNNAYTEEVGDFICEFVQTLSDQYLTKHYVIVAGLKKADIDKLDYEVFLKAGNIKVSPFQQVEIDDYIKALHTELNGEYNIDFSSDELVMQLKASAPFYNQDLFEPQAPPNVKTIGRGIDEWIKLFREKIE
jgi:hypothetical protein